MFPAMLCPGSEDICRVLSTGNWNDDYTGAGQDKPFDVPQGDADGESVSIRMAGTSSHRQASSRKYLVWAVQLLKSSIIFTPLTGMGVLKQAMMATVS